MRMNVPAFDVERNRMDEATSSVEAETTGASRADLLREVIEREHPLLCRRISALVYRVCGRLRPTEVADRVREVLDEAVRRALQAAQSFDPERSAVAWIIGIALR